jgi:branched-chain amino acid transport system permease protein
MLDILLSEPFLMLLGINIIAAIGMNLVYITGQLNLGQAGFMAVGAYSAAVADVELGLPLVPSLLIGGLVAALVALPVAAGAARVHGIYLIMGTLAVGEVVRIAFGNFDAVGGLQGYAGMSPVGLVGVYATLIVITLASVTLMSTHTGLQMRSLFDDEDAAAAAGVATRRVKIFSVVVSAAVVGIAGGLLAKYFLFIAPRNFGLDLSFRIALFTLIGGVHSLLGAFAGAFGITGLLEGLRHAGQLPGPGEAWEAVARWRLAVYGLLVMVLMSFRPEGIVGRRVGVALTAPFRQRFGQMRRARRDEEAAGPSEPSDGEVLEIRGVSHRFGGVVALRDVDLSIASGEIVALIGANGAGKTTCVNVVAGRYRCQEGSIRLRGRDMTGTTAHGRTRAGICRTFQDVRVFSHLTVEETLRLGHASGRGRRRPDVDDLLGLLGLEKKRDRLPGDLTLAEQRRLEIGRALAAAPHVIFLDEPSAGMNETERAELAELIQQIRRGDTAVVLVDHNLDLAFGVAERVVVLDFGEVIARGTPDEILRDERFQEAYLGSEAGDVDILRADLPGPEGP